MKKQAINRTASRAEREENRKGWIGRTYHPSRLLSWRSSVADMDWADGGSMARPLSSRGRRLEQGKGQRRDEMDGNANISDDAHGRGGGARCKDSSFAAI